VGIGEECSLRKFLRAMSEGKEGIIRLTRFLKRTFSEQVGQGSERNSRGDVGAMLGIVNTNLRKGGVDLVGKTPRRWEKGKEPDRLK